MYLNINSECKYTHIYFISNTPHEFFSAQSALAWFRQGRSGRCRMAPRWRPATAGGPHRRFYLAPKLPGVVRCEIAVKNFTMS